MKNPPDPTYDDYCRFCYNEEEDAEHLLCRCEAWENLRLKLFKCTQPDPDDFRNFELKDIYKLADKINSKLSIVT